MNYALQARVEIALHRLLLDLGSLQAWHHYELAIEAAAMAHDVGQADSPLLAGEDYLVTAGRLARDRKIRWRPSLPIGWHLCMTPCHQQALVRGPKDSIS